MGFNEGRQGQLSRQCLNQNYRHHKNENSAQQNYINGKLKLHGNSCQKYSQHHNGSIQIHVDSNKIHPTGYNQRV